MVRQRWRSLLPGGVSHLVLIGLNSKHDFLYSELGEGVDYLLSTFLGLSVAQDNAAGCQKRDTRVSDLGVCVFKYDGFELFLDLLKHLTKLFEVLALSIRGHIQFLH